MCPKTTEILAILLPLMIARCGCWEQFETPLEMATPNSEGIYEFDLLIEHRMAMSSRREGQQQTALVDFVPEKSHWTVRGQNGSIELGNAEQWPDLQQLDGTHTRVVTINGPGKTLVVPLGAKVAMRVRNRLGSQALTIHLHGMDKMHAWWTDGVAFVQQCPIQAGQDFVYRFIADTRGTHWFHGHLMNDRADGLLGGFVVKKLNGGNGSVAELGEGQEVPIGREYYTIVQDWSSTSSQEQWECHIHSTMKWLHGFDEPMGNGAKQKCWAPKRTYDASNVGGSVPLSAILVGEKGWHRQEDIRQHPSKLPLTTFRIKRGENLLLRLVNGGISQGFMFWVEGHETWVLSADGADVKPRKIDALVIFPGERYDVLIKGLDKPGKRQFWLQFETMEYINWDWTLMEQPQVGLAKLDYEDFEGDEPLMDGEGDNVDWTHSHCTAESKCLVLNCPFAKFPAKFNFTCLSAHLLESAEPIEDEELLEAKHFPEHSFHEVFANMHSDNHFDGWAFSHPTGLPYYHEDRMEQVSRRCDPTKCDLEHSAHWDKACECFVNFHFGLGNIVQMTLYNMGEMLNPAGVGYSHPVHIHGTHFLLLKVGYSDYHAVNGSVADMNPDIPCTDPNSRCVGLRWTNTSWLGGNVPGMQQTPSWRDTVNLPVGGYITIRFRARNSGWWFSHCHLMLHNMGGTAFAFRIGSHQQVPKPPDSYPHSCGLYQEPDERKGRQ